MRKRVRALCLGKETLHRLSDCGLRAAAAAVAVRGVAETISQAGDSCLQSCFFNTCYDTCQWEEVNGLG
jgi:hypothetical protein